MMFNWKRFYLNLNLHSEIGANCTSITSFSFCFTVPDSGVIWMKLRCCSFLMEKSKLKSPSFSIVMYLIFFSLM